MSAAPRPGMRAVGVCLAGLVLAALPAAAQAAPGVTPARDIELRNPAGSDAEQARADAQVSARAFEVRYRELTDAADVVGGLLSEGGILTLKPRLKTMVVEDRADVLRRVEALLKSFDLPPRAFEVTLSLFLGRREQEAGAPSASGRGELSSEVRGMVETLGDFTKWTSYELLGSRSVTGIEGDPVLANVAADYRVRFVVDAVHENQGETLIKFKRFTLEREVLSGDGGRDVEELYTAGMVVQANKLTLVVAASAPDSQRALFLALQVHPR